MDLITTVFGEGKDLTALQAVMRAIVVFVVTLVCIRISGRRSFGQRSPFDYVVAILLGATLSRVIVGASPVVPTLAASLVIVLIHRALAWCCVRSPWLESLVVGVEREVYRDGRFDSRQMSAALITRTDIVEAARREFHTRDLHDVHAAILERNGQMSLIRKRPRRDERASAESDADGYARKAR
ncbi:DUF421 domain-containing protein [Paraburkholderia sabiae]|uniref:YetF domain-containing protein n=1 Tax=Paraburkholderia sabiae TaxID=273251 RepID=A0ABU9QCU5_9BURK|nr:YetF domain-containing protein [Paraburkholderia sabiae]WJZ75961.1 DUF421 domain-containing protein [Paraburkholderia sabiae]CAD6527883.1 hypothetical protein LMG24235_02121 [Paraburkholderia sabiae]CAG9219174.1 conserved hypothetical protein [Paraburkholderia sabiae]